MACAVLVCYSINIYKYNKSKIKLKKNKNFLILCEQAIAIYI